MATPPGVSRSARSPLTVFGSDHPLPFVLVHKVQVVRKALDVLVEGLRVVQRRVL